MMYLYTVLVGDQTTKVLAATDAQAKIQTFKQLDLWPQTSANARTAWVVSREIASQQPYKPRMEYK